MQITPMDPWSGVPNVLAAMPSFGMATAQLKLSGASDVAAAAKQSSKPPSSHLHLQLPTVPGFAVAGES